ncbi:MAG: hypothetical protein ACXW2E_01985 [Nitrososphaeraceae archaeon]
MVFVVTRKTADVINELLAMMSNKFHTQQEHESWTETDWQNFISSYKLLTIDLSKCHNVEMKKDFTLKPHVHAKGMTGVFPPDSIIKVEPVKFDWS